MDISFMYILFFTLLNHNEFVNSHANCCNYFVIVHVGHLLVCLETDKKHQASARCRRSAENCHTNKLGIYFRPLFPALQTAAVLFFDDSVFMDSFTHFSYNKSNVKGLFLKGEQIYGTSK